MKTKKKQAKKLPRSGFFGGQIKDACDFGDREAIMIAGFQWMIKEIYGNEAHFYEGRYYKKISHKEIQNFFPMWSPQRIRTILLNLSKLNILMTHTNNKFVGDTTLHYAFVDEQKFLDVGEVTYELDDEDHAQDIDSKRLLKTTHTHKNNSQDIDSKRLLKTTNTPPPFVENNNRRIVKNNTPKEYNSSIESSSPLPPSGEKSEAELIADFAKILLAYPPTDRFMRPEEEEQAFASYKGALLEISHEELLTHIEAYASSRNSETQRDPSKTKYTASIGSYLFKKKWKDQIPKKTQKQATQKQAPTLVPDQLTPDMYQMADSCLGYPVERKWLMEAFIAFRDINQGKTVSLEKFWTGWITKRAEGNPPPKEKTVEDLKNDDLLRMTREQREREEKAKSERFSELLQDLVREHFRHKWILAGGLHGYLKAFLVKEKITDWEIEGWQSKFIQEMEATLPEREKTESSPYTPNLSNPFQKVIAHSRTGSAKDIIPPEPKYLRIEYIATYSKPMDEYSVHEALQAFPPFDGSETWEKNFLSFLNSSREQNKAH